MFENRIALNEPIFNVDKNSKEIFLRYYPWCLQGINFRNVTRLILGTKFNQPLDGVDFMNVEYLDLGNNFNQSIDEVDFKNIKELHLGGSFNQNIDKVDFKNIEYLDLGFKFNQCLENVEFLPQNQRFRTGVFTPGPKIIKLDLGMEFDKSTKCLKDIKEVYFAYKKINPLEELKKPTDGIINTIHYFNECELSYGRGRENFVYPFYHPIFCSKELNVIFDVNKHLTDCGKQICTDDGCGEFVTFYFKEDEKLISEILKNNNDYELDKLKEEGKILLEINLCDRLDMEEINNFFKKYYQSILNKLNDGDLITVTGSCYDGEAFLFFQGKIIEKDFYHNDHGICPEFLKMWYPDDWMDLHFYYRLEEYGTDKSFQLVREKRKLIEDNKEEYLRLIIELKEEEERQNIEEEEKWKIEEIRQIEEKMKKMVMK